MNQKARFSPGADNVEGRYVNYFMIGYNTDVFVIDYFQHFPEDPEACGRPQPPDEPKLRLITSPSDARMLLNSLRAAIKKYEAAYGPIQKSRVGK